MLTALTKKELGIKCKEFKKRELVVINEIDGLDYCLNMIDTVVKDTKLPQEIQYTDEMKELKHKIELLTAENKHVKDMNEQLKNNLNDLRKIKYDE